MINYVKKLIFDIMKKFKLLTFLLLFSAIGVVLCGLIPPQILKYVIDTYLTSGIDNNLLVPALLYFASFVMIGIFEVLKEGILTIYGQKITRIIREAMMSKISRIHSKYFSENASGVIVSRFNNDVDTIQSLFTDGIVGMVVDAFKIVGIIISIWIFSKNLGIIVILMIPFIFILTRFFQKRMLKVQRDNRIAIGRVNNHFPESVKNVQMIRSFGKQKYMEEKYKEHLVSSYKTMQQINFYDAIFSPIILTVKAIIIALIAILSSDSLAAIGISIGMVAASIELISNIFTPIENLGMELQGIQQAIAGTGRINKFLNEDEEVKKNTQFCVNNVITDRDNITVEFQKVKFAYNGANTILDDISFYIQSNENVTFAGRTGVGKSTIFKLILGLLEPDKGSVLVCGVKASDIPNKEKRKVYGYVEQNFRFVNGTVANQISLGDTDITDDMVQLALEFVGLSGYVKSLEHGYDTIAKEYMFSQGQRQLLSIARAIVMNPPIMLLDEITADFDSETEEKIISVLKKAGNERMLLSISHRLSSILSNDRIITLKDGKLEA